MTDDPWARGTFEGTQRAQAALVADLSVDARLALLEQLLEVAEASGALQRAREDKQRAIDLAWFADAPAPARAAGARSADGARGGHDDPPKSV